MSKRCNRAFVWRSGYGPDGSEFTALAEEIARQQDDIRKETGRTPTTLCLGDEALYVFNAICSTVAYRVTGTVVDEPGAVIARTVFGLEIRHATHPAALEVIL